jgi:chemotaxis protein MotB
MYTDVHVMMKRYRCFRVRFLVFLSLACGLIAAGGCVTQGAHDALQKQCDETKSELQGKIDTQQKHIAARDAEILSLQTQLGEKEAAYSEEHRRAESLQDALTRNQSLSADLELRLERLETDIAALTKDKAQLSSSVEEMQSALEELRKRKAEADARVAEYHSLLARFQSLIDAGKLKVKIVDGRMVVELATDVLFDSGKAELSDAGRAAIQEVSKILAEIPNRKFQIEGHTDNVPISNARFASNWELAAGRAITVVNEMIAAGLPPAIISAASYGETRPVKQNTSVEGKAANRRIEIVVVPDLSTLPGFDELQKLSKN